MENRTTVLRTLKLKTIPGQTYKTGLFILLFCLVLPVALLAQNYRLIAPDGHPTVITNFGISPDGKYLASIGYDQKITLWDYKLKKELLRYYGQEDYPTVLAFSPDGKSIASGGTLGKINIWNIKNGETFGSYSHRDRFQNSVNSIAFSPDGNMVASVANDSLLLIYSVPEDTLLTYFKLNCLGIKLKFLPDNSHLIMLDDDNSDGNNYLSFIDLKTMDWNNEKTLQYRHGNIVDFDVSSDGAYVFCLVDTDSGFVRVRSVPDNKDIFRINAVGMIPGKVIASDLKNIFYTSSRKKVPSSNSIQTKVLKWDVNTGSVIDSLEFLAAANTETDAIFPVPGSREFLTSLHVNNLSIFSDNPLKYRSDFTVQPPKSIRRIINTVNNNFVLVDNFGISTIDLLKPFSLKRVHDYNNGSGWGSTVSGDGNKLLLFNYYGNEIKQFDVADVSKVKEIFLDTIITSLELSKTCRFLAQGYGNNSFNKSFRNLRITDLQDSSIIIDTAFLIGFPSIKFSNDERSILIAHNWSDSIIHWDYKNNKISYWKDQVYSKGFPSSINILDDRRVLVSHVGSTKLIIRDIETGKITSVIETGGYDFSVFHDSNTATVTICSPQGEITIYDANSFHKLSVISATGMITHPGFIKNTDVFYAFLPDNLLHFWNYKSGAPLYQLSLLPDNEVLVITPDNYYLASKNASKLLHYVTPELNIVTFEQLDVKYNRPDLVLQALNNSDTLLINSYRKAYEKRIKKLGIDTTAFGSGFGVPEADFQNRESINFEQQANKLTIQIKGQDSSYLLDRLNVWINEVPVFGLRGISLRNRQIYKIDTSFTVLLSAGTNVIETSVTNINGTESYRKPLTINYNPPAPQKEKIFFIGIGIDQFNDSRQNLNYSVKDIRDLSKKLKLKFRDNIIIDTLFNKNVTLSNIKALKKRLQATSVNDRVILSYSGHGLLSQDYDYFLSTYHVNFQNPEEGGLPYDELETLLDGIPSRKKLVLIDACHSGEVDKEEMQKYKIVMAQHRKEGLRGGTVENTDTTSKLGMKNSFELMQDLFVNVGRSTGATIISAAGGTQFAQEGGGRTNGVFTYAILEFLDRNPSATVSDLKQYVNKRVPELTYGLQQPTTRAETKAADWRVW